ncbi:MAG TPA: histidinol dehydrogenase, partial [Phnomibacter sp.]|nr:histidinol dehydrogenase [Phnomibacter sp.]
MQLNTYTNPPRQQWDALLARPTMDTAKLYGLVQPVLETVKQQGDEALRFYTTTFDGVQLNEVLASATEITETAEKTPVQLQQAITQAAANIRAFHLAQQMQPLVMETMPGVRCWRRQVPIEKVGIYIPGGTAPLFSTVLMLAIPAQIAGCKQIVLCTPPDKEGSLHPAIAFAAQLA